MPKKQLLIDKFEGGLNTDFDPRDIADNEFSALKGFSVDSLGVIKMMGSHGNHATITAVASNLAPGYGLFPFSSDYDDAGEPIPTNYLAFTEGTYVKIWDGGASPAFDGMVNVASGGFDLGESENAREDVHASFYAPDGNLRVCDGNFTNYTNKPKRLGFLKKVKYGEGSDSDYPTTLAEVEVGNGASVGGTTQDGWIVNDAMVETGVPSANLKMISRGDHCKGIIEISSGGSGAGGANAINDITANTGTGSPGTVVISNSDLDFGSLNTNNGYYNGLTCSMWGSAGIAKYGVVVDYVYNSGATTGTFKIWSSPTGDTDFYTQGARDDSGNWGFQVGQDDSSMWNADLNGHARNRQVISADYGVTLLFNEGTTLTGGWMPSSDTKYKFYHSTTFDGNQESLPSVFTMYPRKAAATEVAHEAVTEMYFANGNLSLSASSPSGGAVGVAAPEIPVTFNLIVRMRSENDPYGAGNFTIGSTSFDEEDQNTVDAHGEYNFLGGNQRVTGGHIWWASSEDGYKNLWLLSEYDLEKGAKLFGGSGGEGIGAYSPWTSWVYPVATNPITMPTWFKDGVGLVTNPPKLETYEHLFGYAHDTRLNAKWKTSTFANGRAYIGNILRQYKSTFNGGGAFPTNAGEDDLAIKRQGAIVGSPVGRYDIFPEDPNYEFISSPGDGDKIVKLEAFSDRLICFYSNKLEIYNIEKTLEQLEIEIKNMGLDGENPCQACLTDAGVAWINSYGVHFFNGEKVSTISDKIRNQWIGEDGYTAFWKSNSNDVPAIAYDPRAQKLLVVKTISSSGTDNEHVLQFSFKTNSWTYKEEALTNDSNKRFTIYKGDLIFDDATRIQTWSDTAAAGTGSGGNLIYTKDIDFGSPGIDKKIYKVYVTYQSNNTTTNVQVKYGVNGDTTPTETFSDGTNFSSNELDAADGWKVAELKPATSATANNIKSFRLAFTCDNTVPAEFEINDITIIYRMKGIK